MEKKGKFSTETGVFDWINEDGTGGFIKGKDGKDFYFSTENIFGQESDYEPQKDEMVQFVISAADEAAELPEVLKVIPLGLLREDVRKTEDKLKQAIEMTEDD